MDGVGDKRHRVAEDAGDELEDRQQDVPANADRAQAHDGFVAFGGFALGCSVHGRLHDMGDAMWLPFLVFFLAFHAAQGITCACG